MFHDLHAWILANSHIALFAALIIAPTGYAAACLLEARAAGALPATGDKR